MQHSPMTKEGSVGLAELFKRLSQTSPRVEIIRAFEDGDFVFAHVDYDFAEHVTGFEVFRFEDGFAEGADEATPSAIYDLFRLSDGWIVEHWGAIEEIPPRETRNNDNGKF